MVKKIVGYAAIAVVVVFVALQLVPYGRDHTNPPVVAEPAWDSPQTRALAQRACSDCHSNETVWPWYSHIAPASWLLYKHVVDGREELNFSNWAGKSKRGQKLGDVVAKGEMPLPQYLLLHPEARLTAEEKQQLIAGFQKTAP